MINTMQANKCAYMLRVSKCTTTTDNLLYNLLIQQKVTVPPQSNLGRARRSRTTTQQSPHGLQ